MKKKTVRNIRRKIKKILNYMEKMYLSVKLIAVFFYERIENSPIPQLKR